MVGSSAGDTPAGGPAFRASAMEAGPRWVREQGLTWDAVGAKFLAALQRAVDTSAASAAATRSDASASITTRCVVLSTLRQSGTATQFRMPCETALFGPRVMPHEAIAGPAVGVVPSNACEPVQRNPALVGAVAVVMRGKCGFADKALHVQAAGAVAVVVVNAPGQALGPPGTASPAARDVAIPVVLAGHTSVQGSTDQAKGAGAARAVATPVLLTGGSAGQQGSAAVVVIAMARKHRTAEYLSSMADQLAATTQQEAASRHFLQAIAHSPLMLPRAHLGRAWIDLEHGEWRGYERDLAALLRSVELFGNGDACRFIQPAMRVPETVLRRLCAEHWRSIGGSAPDVSTDTGDALWASAQEPGCAYAAGNSTQDCTRRPLRVGFMSSSFGPHPLSRLVQGMFARLVRSPRTVIRCYTSRDKDVLPGVRDGCGSIVSLPHSHRKAAWRKRQRHNHPSRGDSADEADAAAAVVAADHLDVLVDLDALTGTPLHAAVVARRPAPVVVHYLGQPLRHAAAPSLDYFVADARAAVVETSSLAAGQRRAAAHDVRMPWTRARSLEPRPGLLLVPRSFYLDASTPPGQAPGAQHAATANRTKLKLDAGLPTARNRPVLCAFNQLKKVDPTAWRVWMQTLARVPSATLWLSGFRRVPVESQRGDGASTPQKRSEVRDYRRPHPIPVNLRQEAWGLGRPVSQVAFAPWLPKRADHIARLHAADMFMDTLHFTAGSVGVDALRAGVPLITLPGTTFAERQAYRSVHRPHARDYHAFVRGGAA